LISTRLLPDASLTGIHLARLVGCDGGASTLALKVLKDLLLALNQSLWRFELEARMPSR
jgi:hypothetical protein